MRRTIERGCGALVCEHNHNGVCKMRGIVMGSNGNCVLMTIDEEKAREDLRKEEALKQIAGVPTEDTVVNKIGFAMEDSNN